jgi:hypothetical protein
MFGKLLGKLITLPVRLVNVPVKLTQRAIEAGDRFVLGDSPTAYRAPKKNVLDDISDIVEEIFEGTLD